MERCRQLDPAKGRDGTVPNGARADLIFQHSNRRPRSPWQATVHTGDQRTRFYADLAALAPHWQPMCRRARQAIATATGALLDADLERAEQTRHTCRSLDIIRTDCETTAVIELANQAPTDAELRQVLAAVRRLHALARMSAITHEIAELAGTRHPAHTVPEPARPTVERMGAIATQLVTTAAHALATPQRRFHSQLSAQYGVMAGLHRRALHAALYYENAESATAAADLTSIAHAYRQFAEHTTHLGQHATARQPLHYSFSDMRPSNIT
ncbi:phosphate signaling complex PhoU family protein [Nocardia brasiliensis]